MLRDPSSIISVSENRLVDTGNIGLSAHMQGSNMPAGTLVGTEISNRTLDKGVRRKICKISQEAKDYMAMLRAKRT